MKLTNKAKSQIKPGMTLIELTVVIIVLLTLISVLFFAGTAYIKASNRTGCLANQSNIQKGIRGYQNINNEVEGATIDLGVIIGQDLLPGTGSVLGLGCPTDNATYSLGAGLFAPVGSKMVFCTDPTYGDATVSITTTGGGTTAAAIGGDHTPTNTSAW